jgi:hypothetical protein
MPARARTCGNDWPGSGGSVVEILFDHAIRGELGSGRARSGFGTHTVLDWDLGAPSGLQSGHPEEYL